MKKKLLYIITKSNFGGAQRYVYDLATHLPKDEFTPIVALGGTGERDGALGALHEKLSEQHIRTIPIRHFMRDISFIEDIKAFFEIIRIVRNERPDILHVTSSKAGGMGVVVGRLLRVKRIIFTSHGLAFDEDWRPFWQRALIACATWWTFLFAHYTIQITQDTLLRAQRMPFMKRKHVRIYNGITAPTLLPREKARATLFPHYSNSDVWIGTLAELTKNKNLDVLVRALSVLHDKGIPAHLFICGEGEERAHLEHLVVEKKLEQYVHMLGYVQNASRFLYAFDIFALPSRKEGLPYVLIEAGYASLPTVASSIPGIEDVVQNGISGKTVEANPTSFGTALWELLNDTEIMRQYGETLHAHVTHTFSIEHMVANTVRLYSDPNPSISLSSFSRRTERS